MTKKEQMLRDIFDYHTIKIPDTQSNSFYRYWGKSYNHFNIIVLLGSVANDSAGYSYEDICDIYPHKLASRTTILSILNEVIENNFFLKRKNPKDHRKHNYKLMPEQKKMLLIGWKTIQLDN